jgi:hypothetical protein
MAKELSELYESDFYRWTVRNAALLREGRVAEADISHIAEEMQDMAISQRRELLSRLSVLLRRLLKCEFSKPPPKVASARNWTATIREQRGELARLLEQMASLRRFLERSLAKIYREAAEDSIFEGGLETKRIPDVCPYSVEQILDLAHLPRARQR